MKDCCSEVIQEHDFHFEISSEGIQECADFHFEIRALKNPLEISLVLCYILKSRTKDFECECLCNSGEVYLGNYLLMNVIQRCFISFSHQKSGF